MQFSTSCPDWERRIVEGESLVPFDPPFPDEAAAAFHSDTDFTQGSTAAPVDKTKH